jgi:nucleotide-binding universal stress UspA family protein
MFEKILVCLDGSNFAEQILPYVEPLATCFNSRVVLLQVAKSVEPEETGVTPVITPVLEEVKDAQTYLENAALRLEGEGIDVQCEAIPVMNGQPGKGIINYADKNGIDLITLTTHGKSGLDRAVMGSVADTVVRESGKPVLVVCPEENGKE